jgi:hypothetical protein
MKYILYLILTFLLVSYFLPIIPIKKTVLTGIMCIMPPCPEAQTTYKDFVTLMQFAKHEY